MSTTTTLSTLTINYLTQAQYDAALAGGTIDENQLYFVPDSGGGGTITGVTAGTGLSGGGDTGSVTLNHSNSITAQATQAFYPVAIDAQGHITSYGTAVTPFSTTGGTISGATTFSSTVTYHSLTMPAILVGSTDPSSSTVLNQLQDGDIYVYVT